MTKIGIEMTTSVEIRTRLSMNLPLRIPEHAGRDADNGLEEQGDDRQLQGDDIAFLQLIQDVQALEGGPEIPPQQVPEVLGVADEQQVIEVVVGPGDFSAKAAGQGRSPHLPASGSPGRAKTMAKIGKVGPRIPPDHLQQASDDVFGHRTSEPSLDGSGGCVGETLSPGGGKKRYRAHKTVVARRRGTVGGPLPNDAVELNARTRGRGCSGLDGD